MAYGLTYNPGNRQDYTNVYATGPSPNAVAPTFNSLSTFKNPNLPNNYLDPATGTYRDWGSMANALTSQNAGTVGKVDWFNAWRQHAMQNMNPDQQAAFDKQFPGQVAFDWHPGVKSNWGLNYGAAAPNAPAAPPTGRPKDAFADYWSKQMLQQTGTNMSPEDFRNWYNNRVSPPKKNNDVAERNAYAQGRPDEYGGYGA